MIASRKEASEQFAEVAQLFDPSLPLKKIEDLFRPDLEAAHLRSFYKGGARIPFFGDDVSAADFRFLHMAPNAPEGFKTSEAPGLMQYTTPVLLRSAPGSGKTSTILDMGCATPLIYVACKPRPYRSGGGESKEKHATADAVFPLMVEEIFPLHLLPYAWQTTQQLYLAQQEARRLIMADICARLCFFTWLHLQFPGITPEQALLAQITDGRALMVDAFRLLIGAHIATLEDLARYCEGQLRELVPENVPIRVAIDDAQEAAPYFYSETGHGLHFAHVKYAYARRGLLYEYSRLWMQYFPALVVADSGANSDAAGHLSEDFHKETLEHVQLPFLKIDDVKARLEALVNLTEDDWRQVQVDKLEFLTGRCRLVVSVVEELMHASDDEHYSLSKAQLLEVCIERVKVSAARKLADDVVRLLNSGTRYGAYIRRLVLQLYGIACRFGDRTQRMRSQFEKHHLISLLQLGLLLESHRPDSAETEPDIVMDKIGVEALFMVAEKKPGPSNKMADWNAAAPIPAHHIPERRQFEYK